MRRHCGPKENSINTADVPANRHKSKRFSIERRSAAVGSSTLKFRQQNLSFRFSASPVFEFACQNEFLRRRGAAAAQPAERASGLRHRGAPLRRRPLRRRAGHQLLERDSAHARRVRVRRAPTAPGARLQDTLPQLALRVPQRDRLLRQGDVHVRQGVAAHARPAALGRRAASLPHHRGARAGAGGPAGGRLLHAEPGGARLRALRQRAARPRHVPGGLRQAAPRRPPSAGAGRARGHLHAGHRAQVDARLLPGAAGRAAHGEGVGDGARQLRRLRGAYQRRRRVPAGRPAAPLRRAQPRRPENQQHHVQEGRRRPTRRRQVPRLPDVPLELAGARFDLLQHGDHGLRRLREVLRPAARRLFGRAQRHARRKRLRRLRLHPGGLQLGSGGVQIIPGVHVGVDRLPRHTRGHPRLRLPQDHFAREGRIGESSQKRVVPKSIHELVPPFRETRLFRLVPAHLAYPG